MFYKTLSVFFFFKSNITIRIGKNITLNIHHINFLILSFSKYSAGITNNVIVEPDISQNIIVNPSPAQNSSCKARGNTPNTVVRVVTIIGCNLVFPASTIATNLGRLLLMFLFILSINIIASFTTTQVRAINHIANGIL